VFKQPSIRRKSPAQIAKMRKAGRVVAEMHECIRAAIRPGVTTLELDAIGREVIERRGAISNFLGYNGTYPAVICASPNDVVVHGIPGPVRLQEGDIIAVDCGAIVDGWHGDAAFTAGVGTISPEAQRLLDVTEASLLAGIEPPCSAWRRAPASRSSASTWATPSARPCTRSRRCPTTAPPGGASG
jgi:methionyl aminopeptidase